MPFSTRSKISSNRTNDRSWMTGLGRLATDGVMWPEQPGQTEKLRFTSPKQGSNPGKLGHLKALGDKECRANHPLRPSR
jgi:hypothetical protein